MMPEGHEEEEHDRTNIIILCFNRSSRSSLTTIVSLFVSMLETLTVDFRRIHHDVDKGTFGRLTLWRYPVYEDDQ
jgi:hypothetical protein